MKQFLSISLLLVLNIRLSHAQDEGVILYDVKVNLHKTLPNNDPAMKEMLPEFRVHKDRLFFNDKESLYVPVEEDDEDIDNGEGMVMRLKRPETEIYLDKGSLRRVQLQEFMGKKYLMDDTLLISPWKFDTEIKNLLGYDCRKATFYNEETKTTVIAWYTEKIRPFLGPENFNSLPGAVLQVDINDGERILTATKIETRPLKKDELRIPRGGIKTTEKEFLKTRKEQIERMRANGGNIIIRN